LRLFPVPPSITKLMNAIWNGEFDGIAQTKAFFERVALLKHKIDMVYLLAETRHVYLPKYITSAQRGVPMSGATPLGTVGQQLDMMPLEVGQVVGRPRHRRVGSRVARALGMAHNF